MPLMKWPPYIHRKTFFVVLAVDTILLPIAIFLASHDVKSWLIAAPMLAINIPSMPLAILFSIFGEEDNSMSMRVVIGMFASEAIVSAWVWGILIARLKKRPEISN